MCEGLKNGNEYCYDPTYVSRICNLHPIQLIKRVRVRVDHVKQLIEEKNLDLKIIALDKVIIAKYEELATVPNLAIPVILKVTDGLSLNKS